MKNITEIMKGQTIGVEIEMSGITRESAARIFAAMCDTRNSVNHVGSTYDTWTALDTKGRTWKFMRDSSIVDSHGGCEMVTPILNYDDIEFLQKAVRQMRTHGAHSNALYGCGIHVHVGCTHTPSEIRNLVNYVQKNEKVIQKMVGISESRVYRWCKPVDERFWKELNAKKPKTMEALADIWYTSQGAYCGRGQHYNPSRYHLLNLHATFTKGTIEFRAFEFSRDIHAGELKAFIQLALALSARGKLSTVHAKEESNEVTKESCVKMLNKLGLKGSEFRTARNLYTGKFIETATEATA